METKSWFDGSDQQRSWQVKRPPRVVLQDSLIRPPFHFFTPRLRSRVSSALIYTILPEHSVCSFVQASSIEGRDEPRVRLINDKIRLRRKKRPEGKEAEFQMGEGGNRKNGENVRGNSAVEIKRYVPARCPSPRIGHPSRKNRSSPNSVRYVIVATSQLATFTNSGFGTLQFSAVYAAWTKPLPATMFFRSTARTLTNRNAATRDATTTTRSSITRPPTKPGRLMQIVSGSEDALAFWMTTVVSLLEFVVPRAKFTSPGATTWIVLEVFTSVISWAARLYTWLETKVTVR